MSKKQWPQKLFWAIVDDMTIHEQLAVAETIIRRARQNPRMLSIDSEAHAAV